MTFESAAPVYDVQMHSLSCMPGLWVRYRHNGWCTYPMQIARRYEIGLRMARFRHFTCRVLDHKTSLPYQDPLYEPDAFSEVVSWIDMRSSGWNFRIDGGGMKVQDRQVHFSFSDYRVAVEFKLRWG